MLNLIRRRPPDIKGRGGTMLKKLVLALVVVASFVGATSSAAQGVSPAQLKASGWTCFDVPGLGVHCAAPGKGFPPTGAVVQLLYFDTTDPDSTDAAFLGTETLIRADIFLRAPNRPCPRGEEGPNWFPIDFGAPFGVYYACHHR
jgi:hypothetical protein